MPTATATITRHSYASPLPVKTTIMSNGSATSPLDSSAPTPTPTNPSFDTLRSLYSRAAKAFVLRDISLTYSLIQSAFAILKPPTVPADSLADQRRKWDILRITFESTVYLSSPSPDTLPETLRANLTESPQALATSTYARSLALFTPCVANSSKSALNAASLPSQVLTTLIYFTLKINAPDVGRTMIEDWLARREPQYSLGASNAGDGSYDKVLDLYCLHILPKLEEWEYAQEFLDYENELPVARREELKSSLKAMHTQVMESRRAQRTIPSLPPSNPSTPRPHSPTPSSSSSSSSLSTTSTHTVVPSTVKGNRPSASPSRNNTHARIPSTSASSSSTTTPRGRHAQLSSISTSLEDGPRSTSRTHSATSSTFESLSRSRHGHQTALITEPSRPPSLYTLVRAYMAPYLTSKRFTTFALVFVLVPVVSFLFRVRRRRQMGAAAAAAAAGSMNIGAGSAVRNADLVRRRLHSVGGGVAGDAGLITRAWGEVVRVVGDTVKMAGSGLV